MMKNCYQDCKIKENDKVMTHGTHAEMRNTYTILVRKVNGRDLMGYRGTKDDIKMDAKETGCLIVK
jgi:hypothetical protein